MVELIIAVAIIGGVIAVSTQLLYRVVTSRSQQYTLEDSVETIRLVTRTITSAITTSDSLSIPNSHTLTITSQPCQTFRFNSTGSFIEHATDTSANCTPPNSGFVTLTPDNLVVTSFDFSPVSTLPDVVNISLEGYYNHPFGQQPINISTTAVPRITL